jgi:hypothetical protein
MPTAAPLAAGSLEVLIDLFNKAVPVRNSG